jgi:predicted Na+-dependent transporter
VLNLVGVVLLPAIIGLVVRARTRRLADLTGPWVARLATTTLLVALAAGVASIEHFSALVTSWVPVAALMITLAGLLLGAVVGTQQGKATLVTTSVVTGTRFGALGLLVIATAFPDDHRYEDAGLVAALTTMITVVVVGMMLRFEWAARARSLFKTPTVGVD